MASQRVYHLSRQDPNPSRSPSWTLERDKASEVCFLRKICKFWGKNRLTTKTFCQHSSASRWFSLNMATRSGSPPYQFLICENEMEAWVALSALCGDTDHILKQVFGKPGFPCVEEKKAFFQISEEGRRLVGISHLGEGLNHHDHADIMMMMMLMMMRMMMIVQGCYLKLLHLHSDFVIRRRNA